MHTHELVLHPQPPFDFRHTLAFLKDFRPAMGDQQIEGDTLAKAFIIEGHIVLTRLRSTGSIGSPALNAHLTSAAPIDLDAVQNRLTNWLSLNDDLEPFYAIGRDDPAFAPIIDDLYGYHQARFPSAFENAVWAMLSQRNLMSVARTMKDGLTARYGQSITVDGTTYYAFPEAADLALPTPDELNEVVGNRWKSETVSGVARAFAQVDEHWLAESPYEVANQWLRSVKGIGPWSASFILLRGLGRMERLPVAEKWLLKAASQCYGLPTLTEIDLQKLARPYGDYAGYWAHYLRVGI